MFQNSKIAVALYDLSNYILLKKSSTANRTILNQAVYIVYNIFIYIQTRVLLKQFKNIYKTNQDKNFKIY